MQQHRPDPDDLAHHQIGDLAERVYTSADIGHAKPDPRIYTHVLHNAQLNPARALYVNDIASWVRASRQLGMRGHRYTGATPLRRTIAQAGVAV